MLVGQRRQYLEVLRTVLRTSHTLHKHDLGHHRDQWPWRHVMPHIASEQIPIRKGKSNNEEDLRGGEGPEGNRVGKSPALC